MSHGPDPALTPPQFPNVTFLQNEAALLPLPSGATLRVLGTTLWGNCPDAASQLRDFRRIYDADGVRKLAPPAMRDMHAACRAFLEDQLAADAATPTLVLSHHAPLPEMNGPFVDHPFASAYATDLRHLMAGCVRGWICGHVHINGRFEHNGVPVVSNQLGYPGEKVVGYRTDAVLRL